MNFYLNNIHRKYMGLKPLENDYELVIVKSSKGEENYLFFDGTHLKKKITYWINDYIISMTEDDLDYEVNEDRTMLLPKTKKGKMRKLNLTTIHSLNGIGNYFFICYNKERKQGQMIIGNYTTQRTFYQEENIKDCDTLEKIKNWCDKFVEDRTEKDVEEVQRFSQAKRKHINFQEGDIFRVKLGRNQYVYGRVLMNIYKRQKNGLQYWDIFMGRPVIVEVFRFITNRKDMRIEELSSLPTFPAQHIMDNKLYYGDYEIIGHGDVPKKVKYPIMYGKSISGTEPNKIMFQCGEIYKEIDYKNENLIRQENYNFLDNNFRNNGIGFFVDIQVDIAEKCMSENSNNPYWEAYQYHASGDLRAPQNREYLKKVLEQFHLEDLFTIYNE